MVFWFLKSWDEGPIYGIFTKYFLSESVSLFLSCKFLFSQHWSTFSKNEFEKPLFQNTLLNLSTSFIKKFNTGIHNLWSVQSSKMRLFFQFWGHTVAEFKITPVSVFFLYVRDSYVPPLILISGSKNARTKSYMLYMLMMCLLSLTLQCLSKIFRKI